MLVPNSHQVNQDQNISAGHMVEVDILELDQFQDDVVVVRFVLVE